MQDELARMIVQRIGLRVRETEAGHFVDILRRRIAHLGFLSLQDYRDSLQKNESVEEWEELARLLSVSETFFFRDHGQFDLLHIQLLPTLIARHQHDKTLRLWSAGCSSGEEAYSLAILIDQHFPELIDWNIHIIGTDIDSKLIAKALCGRYGAWSFRMVSEEIKSRYFHVEGDDWLLDERIRSKVSFRVSNLVTEPFPDFASDLHDMDLILCRNVFIYFAPSTVYAVASKLAATLCEKGYLLTAHTELIGHEIHGLKSLLLPNGVVYQHDSASISPVFDRSIKLTTQQSNGGISMDHAVGSSCGVDMMERSVLPLKSHVDTLVKQAQTYADQGNFDLAEQVCRTILDVDPLVTTPYFLLAQLAEVKCDLKQAIEYLNKAIYLDSVFVAAYLALAKLYERTEEHLQAEKLRRAVLAIIYSWPENKIIEEYGITVGELVQWLIGKLSIGENLNKRRFYQEPRL